MEQPQLITVDGNEAVARVAHRLSEVVAIYPITPASPMAELCDSWSAAGQKNLWGAVPDVVEMQSEAGAAGAVHGALQAGALATTFTASQGLLLMLPDMYKIAGELTPFCMHVAARTVATHALSIFGDHSDVMAARQTGFAMLFASSVQEAQDLALVAHAATLRSRIPMVHIMDGFRTSHELTRIAGLEDADLRALVDERDIRQHRARALSPDHPVIRGTSQNPDTFFQAAEASNPYHLACPRIVQEVMDAFSARTGRAYRLFEYTGHPRPERVVILMGSGAETARETVRMMAARDELVGVITVHLYRPFSVEHLLQALPRSVRGISVLDRTREPGAPGGPLYLDVVAALADAVQRNAWPQMPRVLGGRYGLASKEFTPRMVHAALDALRRPAQRTPFTVGINDDVTGASLATDSTFELPLPQTRSAIFHGLGSDGTVGATRLLVKLLAEEEGMHAQAYFVYDSRKSGQLTSSHLRYGPHPIRAPYLVEKAGFVGVHHRSFLNRPDVLDRAAPHATLLLNVPWSPSEVWRHIPAALQETIRQLQLKVFTVDADGLALSAGLPGRGATAMQVCFLVLTDVLPRDAAVDAVKRWVADAFEHKGGGVVTRNLAIAQNALSTLVRLVIPRADGEHAPAHPMVPAAAPDFAQRVTALLLAGHGDSLPVSAFPVDGTWPTGTSRYEKRGLAREVPVWAASQCIQCNKCTLMCPHAALRARAYPAEAMLDVPLGFRAAPFRAQPTQNTRYTIQVSPDDCTGCGLCVSACPVQDVDTGIKPLQMEPTDSVRTTENQNFAFFDQLPEGDRIHAHLDVKGSQLLEPLFEFSGACTACGEAPYIKLLTQLFGDRLVIANATGCSSIFGGNLPTTPYTVNDNGRGPAWSNSLFEDNAEFGMGLRLGSDHQQHTAQALLRDLAPHLPAALVEELLTASQADDAGIAAQRNRVRLLLSALRAVPGEAARNLEQLSDLLVQRSVWAIGGDGWAYDIGFGGLDHVLAQGRKVNILVLDTGVYSNTGGQQSKATPLGASARFAAGGKRSARKDLALMAMTYGNVYVAQVAMGAKDSQTVKALVEAEAHPGPSLVIAYAHCIAHGFAMSAGLEHQHDVVASGAWPLFRFDPARTLRGEPALKLESGEPTLSITDFMRSEGRFGWLDQAPPHVAEHIRNVAAADIQTRRALYHQLATLRPPEAPKRGT